MFIGIIVEENKDALVLFGCASKGASLADTFYKKL